MSLTEITFSTYGKYVNHQKSTLKCFEISLLGYLREPVLLGIYNKYIRQSFKLHCYSNI